MAEMHGMNGTLFVKDEDGEWAEVGEIRATGFMIGVEKAIADLENWRPPQEVVVRFQVDMKNLFRSFLRWLHGVPLGHGGAKMRRRKHGGRWAKLDRRQRVPPAWLVRLHHGQ